MNVNHAPLNVPTAQKSAEFPQQNTAQLQNNRQSQHNNSMSKEVNRNEVKSTVKELNDFVELVATDLKFVFHDDLNEYYVTVVDPLTKEVVREIPPKKLLDMYAAMNEFMGILVDKKI